MKQIYLFLAAFFVACMSAFADDGVTVTFSPSEVSPGDQVVMTVGIDNTTSSFKGFQMSLNVPEGFEIATGWDDDEEESVPMIKKGDLLKSGHTISYNKVDESTYNFLCIDMGNATFKAREASLMVITFNVSETLTSGVFQGKITGIEFTNSSDHGTKFEDVTFQFVIVPTKINGVSTDLQTKSVYNIAGQQLNGAQKGINIVDGKKVMVK